MRLLASLAVAGALCAPAVAVADAPNGADGDVTVGVAAPPPAPVAPDPIPPPMLNVAPASYAGADVLLRAALVVVDADVGAFCPAELYVYDEADPVSAARGDTPGCRVYYRRGERNTWWWVWTDPARSHAERVDAAAYVCATLEHERLHNQGFNHTATGLMARAPIQPVDYPAACTTWARAITPERTHTRHDSPEAHPTPGAKCRARRAGPRARRHDAR